MAEPLTHDHLLGGRVRLTQPAAGYRVAIDPVLLAAAVPAGPGERVLDAGAGTGAAALCLAARVPECQVVGLELQRDLQRIASANVLANGLARRVEVMVGDLGKPPPRLVAASFEHVMTNPPYLPAHEASAPAQPGRAAATIEGGLDLGRWVEGCARMLRPGGRLTLIHRADRLPAVLAALTGRLGEVIVFPLWPGPGERPAKRILVQARKGARAPLRLARGLALHGPDGRYTEAAERVLRHGAPLDLPGTDG